MTPINRLNDEEIRIAFGKIVDILVKNEATHQEIDDGFKAVEIDVNDIVERINVLEACQETAYNVVFGMSNNLKESISLSGDLVRKVNGVEADMEFLMTIIKQLSSRIVKLENNSIGNSAFSELFTKG